MKKLIFACCSLIVIFLALYFFFGFPISQIRYLSGYNKDNFPYKICEEDRVCEVKVGELFAHKWFVDDKSCISGALAGYGYRTNYRFSKNIKDTGKKGTIKLPRQDWIFSCPMAQYALFKAEKSNEEYYFEVDFNCIHEACEERVIKSSVKVLPAGGKERGGGVY